MPGSPVRKRNHNLRKKTVDEARKQRRTMSLPEALLWRELRSDRLGMSFRKQHPIGPYKADFYCSARKLVIEVDGFAHDTLSGATRDEVRDAYMKAQGYTVLRIPAADVLRDIGAVLDAIRVAAAPLHRAGAVPLPVNGEDLK